MAAIPKDDELTELDVVPDSVHLPMEIAEMLLRVADAVDAVDDTDDTAFNSVDSRLNTSVLNMFEVSLANMGDFLRSFIMMTDGSPLSHKRTGFGSLIVSMIGVLIGSGYGSRFTPSVGLQVVEAILALYCCWMVRTSNAKFAESDTRLFQVDADGGGLSLTPFDVLPVSTSLPDDTIAHSYQRKQEILQRQKDTSPPLPPDWRFSYSQKGEVISIAIDHMTLVFEKWKTYKKHVGPSGKKIGSEFFSLTIPPETTLNGLKSFATGFTVYRFNEEESKGVTKGVVITDLLVLRPCGAQFNKKVKLYLSHTGIQSIGSSMAVLYEPSSSPGAFVATPTKYQDDCSFDVRGCAGMEAKLFSSCIEINTSHFCKVFACLFNCKGHVFRAMAFEKHKSDSYKVLDLYFTSNRVEHVKVVEDHCAGRSQLLNENARIYFSSTHNKLTVAPPAGWEHVQKNSLVLRNSELMDTKSNCQKFCNRTIILERKSEEEEKQDFLVIVNLTGKKTNCCLALSKSADVVDAVMSPSLATEKELWSIPVVSENTSLGYAKFETNNFGPERLSEADVCIVSVSNMEREEIRNVLEHVANEKTTGVRIEDAAGNVKREGCVVKWAPWKERRPIRLALFQQAKTGRNEVSQLLHDIAQLEPGLVAMVGVCTGADDKVNPGDLLVPLQLQAISEIVGGDREMSQEPTVVQLNSKMKVLVTGAAACMEEYDWEKFLPNPWKGRPPIPPSDLEGKVLLHLNGQENSMTARDIAGALEIEAEWVKEAVQKLLEAGCLSEIRGKTSSKCLKLARSSLMRKLVMRLTDDDRDCLLIPYWPLTCPAKLSTLMTYGK
eukprot:m.229422 g.229422  ORF g.229422 m.229422 type:complete len:833 (+) comp40044_c0_seq4:75-2573(+)